MSLSVTKLIKQIISKPPRIAVVGDYIEDRYLLTSVSRLSPEAPVPVARKIDEMIGHGGAGHVWEILQNIGCDAYLFCDGDPANWVDDVGRVFINPGVHSVKTRVMSGQHHLLRIDEEPDAKDIMGGTFKSNDWALKFESMISQREFDCVVISDYHKGVVSKNVAEMVIAWCKDMNIPCIVDAKKGFERFGGATIVKCNEEESSGMGDIREYLESMQVRHVVVTMGASGIRTYRAHHEFRVPGIQVPIVDVCGAGDTVTAILALCGYVDDMDITDAIEFANHMAAESCKYPGVWVCSHEDMMKYDSGH